MFLKKNFKHDLKNPISAMIGYSEYILEEIESDEYIPYINDVNLIYKSCKKINSNLDKSINTFKNDKVVNRKKINNFQFEIRTTLSSIVGLIELIRDKIEETENSEDEFLDCINNIYESCNSMSKIIDNIEIYYEEDKSKPSKIKSKKSQYTKKVLKHDYKNYNGNILIIDDDIINSKLMEKILLKLDHNVHKVHNGKDALQSIENNKYDLILLDIIMPDMNGIELLQIIRSNDNYYNIPVIMITALDDLNSIVDCITIGATDYITKPIDKILLDARINSCLERKEYRDKEKEYLDRIKYEEKKSNDLLLNIMPASIAERLKRGEKNIADRFENVSVLFADISGFTEHSSNISPQIIVKELNDIFSLFDDLVDKYNVEKIKTIGDNYMIASGIPYENKMHAETIVDLALEMKRILPEVNKTLILKIGVSSGEIVAGVIGKKKFIYDLWGDTVNVASRMERYGEDNRIQVSSNTYEILKNKYKFSKKNKIFVKGKGNMDTYLLEE